MKKYNKPPLTHSQQSELLLNRNLVADKERLLNTLKDISYYRLSGYLYPYRQLDDSYVPGTTFEKVYRHYRFDRQLRIIIMDAIERFEVSVRSRLTYNFVHKHGPFGYLERKYFPMLESEVYGKWLYDLESECNRSKEKFIEHFRENYGDYHSMPPLWMTVETMSFGKLLTFFNGVEDDIRKKVAAEYGISDYLLKSWLLTLNYIRNICAHHGRLWDRELRIKPFIPPRNKFPYWYKPFKIQNNKIYCVMVILRFLLRISAPQSEWHFRVIELFEKFNDVPLRIMGFPDNWKETKLWE